VIKAGVEAAVGWGDAGDVVKSGIERFGRCKVCCPISARCNGGEQVGGYRAAVCWL
jgi:hypothetical protein